jgi:hypothetical protein
VPRSPDEQEEVPSVTAVVEDDIVRWLFSHRPGRLLVNLALGMPSPSFIDCHVTTPLLEERKGRTSEIDAVAWPMGLPQQAVAIEVKRVRVSEDAFVTDEPGGLRALEKGAMQANSHLKSSFSRAYLCTAVQVDGRLRSSGSWLEGGLTDSLQKRVLDAVRGTPVHREVGILVLELRQPVQRNALDAGGLGLLYHRPATARVQSDAVTSRMVLLAKESRKGRIEW